MFINFYKKLEVNDFRIKKKLLDLFKTYVIKKIVNWFTCLDNYLTELTVKLFQTVIILNKQNMSFAFGLIDKFVFP